MQHSDKRLFLLDAYALIFRAYYAFIRNPIKNSKGLNTSAIYGFTNSLIELIQKENPTHLSVVFDAEGKTDRAEAHSFYKANREETPEDIKQSVPIIKEIIQAFHIPILELAGYEADDVIGTIAKQKEKEGYTVYMVTPDKDFAQLVSPNIFMYKPSRQGKGVDILGVEEIKQSWEVEEPIQVIDILGMWGDSVDNIPGIPGIGEKTAKKLIKEYKSLEGVIEHADELKGKMRENVLKFAEQGQISKHLATIIIDAPITVSEEDLLLSEPDKDKLSKLFAELEFRTLGKRILGDAFSVNQNVSANGQIDLFTTSDQNTHAATEIERGKTIENTAHTYHLLTDEKEFQHLAEKLQQQKAFAFDTETTGLDPITATIVGISFSFKANEGYYIPISEDNEQAIQTLRFFKSALENDQIVKIGQNIKYDIHILHRYDIAVKLPINDTMLSHYLIEPEMRHNLDYLSETYLGYTPMPIESLIGKKGPKQISFREVDIEQAKEYAAEDADITWQLHNKLIPLVKEREVKTLLDTVELPLIPVLSKMEQTGVSIDVVFLHQYSEELLSELVEIKSNIFQAAGVEFNLDSPKQLGEVLFDKLKIPYKGSKTKTGQYKTGEDKLLSLSNEHAIANDILEYRQIAKLKSTYVDALPKLVKEETGRVHTTFNQTIAATGRLSSVNPNLQNIPIRTKRGRHIRKAFVAGNANQVLMSADYSQIELRLIAHLSGDNVMQQAFIDKQDIHTTTAASIFNVSPDEVTREMRSHAKVVNFGIIYGVSAFGLSQQTKLSRTESKEIITSYFKTYPEIKAYMDNNIEFARQHGYVQTLLGRKRYLKDINSKNAILRGHAERNAINAPVQGSAADLIKVAMIHIHEKMEREKLRSSMTLQVHDELLFEVYKEEVDVLKELVISEMEQAIPGLTVPIIVEVGIGDNWLEAH